MPNPPTPAHDVHETLFALRAIITRLERLDHAHAAALVDMALHQVLAELDAARPRHVLCA